MHTFSRVFLSRALSLLASVWKRTQNRSLSLTRFQIRSKFAEVCVCVSDGPARLDQPFFTVTQIGGDSPPAASRKYRFKWRGEGKSMMMRRTPQNWNLTAQQQQQQQKRHRYFRGDSSHTKHTEQNEEGEKTAPQTHTRTPSNDQNKTHQKHTPPACSLSFALLLLFSTLLPLDYTSPFSHTPSSARAASSRISVRFIGNHFDAVLLFSACVCLCVLFSVFRCVTLFKAKMSSSKRRVCVV